VRSECNRRGGETDKADQESLGHAFRETRFAVVHASVLRDRDHDRPKQRTPDFGRGLGLKGGPPEVVKLLAPETSVLLRHQYAGDRERYRDKQCCRRKYETASCDNIANGPQVQAE